MAFFSWLVAFFSARNDLGLELAALRHQVAVLRRKNARPRLNRWDRLFWLTLRRRWSSWTRALVIVKPETVVHWHRAGSVVLAIALSPPPRPTEDHLRAAKADSVHASGESDLGRSADPQRAYQIGIRDLGMHVFRYLAQIVRPRESGKGWLTFLKNHREAIRSDGFLHRAHGNPPCALLLFVMSLD